MKTNKYIGLLLFMASIFASCKKDASITTASSLNVIDASADAPSIAVNFTATPIPFYKNQALVSYGSTQEFGIPSGTTPYSIVSSADTTKTMLHGTLNLVPGGVYSLFFSGTLPNIDTVFVQDHIPVHADSTSGIRFINLSPDAGPLNINLQGNMTNEFAGLAYKKITTFKSYSAIMGITNNGGYTYEIRDAAANLLATLNWNPKVFRNNTVVVGGLVSSSAGLRIIKANNY